MLKRNSFSSARPSSRVNNVVDGGRGGIFKRLKNICQTATNVSFTRFLRDIATSFVIPPEIKDAIFFLRGNCRRIFFLTLFHYFHIQNSLNFVEKFSTRKINYPGDFRDNRFFFFLLIRFFEWMDGKGEFFWSIPTHTHTHTGRTQNNGDITTIKIYGLLFASFEKSASWKFHRIIKVACQRN